VTIKKFAERDKQTYFIKDKDGNYLSAEEEIEYMNDLFSGGIPGDDSYFRDFMWPKWGERLGIPKPE
jgi:hypothetical protein